jgi:DNA-binding beta-propeller fold protein YncE
MGVSFLKRLLHVSSFLFLCFIVLFSCSLSYAADQNVELIDTWVQTEVNGGGRFMYPMGIAADSGGNIYISDSINSRIQKLSSNGEFLQFIGATVWDEQGFVEQEVYYPIGLDVDQEDNIYVADSGLGEVKVFDSTGKYIRSWEIPDVPAQSEPVDVACSGGSVYVTDKKNHRILKYSSEGSPISEWG